MKKFSEINLPLLLFGKSKLQNEKIKNILVNKNINYKIITFESQKKLIEVLCSREFGVIILDITNLPQYGINLFKKIKNEKPSVPVIIIDSSFNEDRFAEFNKLGIAGYEIRKHFIKIIPLLNKLIIKDKLNDKVFETEKLLNEYEKFYRPLTDLAFEGLFFHKNGILIDCSESLAKMFGYQKDEIVGKNIIDLFITDKYKDIVIEKLINDNVAPYKMEIKNKEGNKIDVELTARSFTYKNEQIRAVSIRDLSKSNKIEETLNKNKKYFNTNIDFPEPYENGLNIFKINDIIEIEHLQKIQDSFAEATGVASMITDIKGNPITKPSNFCKVCDYIRNTKLGMENCMRSDKILGAEAQKEMRPIYKKCHSCGFVDASAPIIVAGKHIANWLIGQSNVMGVDEKQIKEYAIEIGVDVNKITKAFKKTQQRPLKQFEKILDLLWIFTKELSTLGYNNLLLSKELSIRKNIQNQLSELNQRFHEIFNSSPLSIILLDQNLIVKMWNSAAEKMFGWKAEEIIGKKYPIVPREKEDEVQYHVKSTLEGKPLTNIETFRKKKDGSNLNVNLSTATLNDSDGNYVGAISIISDISEQIKVREELELYQNKLETLVKERTDELETAYQRLEQEMNKQKKAEKKVHRALLKEKELSEMKSRFISMASHEFRTPLTTIMLSAELLERYGRKWNEEKYKSQISKITNTIDDLTVLIDDVLIVSRAETGKINFNPDYINFKSLCNEIVEDISLLADKNRKITSSFELNQDNFYIDEKLIKYIILNLLSNAVKYSVKGGNISFKAKEHNKKLVIEISDSGIGIPKEDQKYLFTPFHRGENAHNIPGTGLGLSIVKKSVDILGGKIKYESRLNKGTKFIVNIPVKSQNSKGMA